MLVDDLECRERTRWKRPVCRCSTLARAGPVSARWHDGRAQLGHHVELLRRGPEIEGFYELIRSSSVGWDGSDPLRAGPGAH